MNILMKLFAVVALMATFSPPTMAADIRGGPGKGSGWIVIEGNIEPGDYEKFRAFVLNHVGEIVADGDVFLASPGGDLLEAMKIGRLIRKLRLTTMIPARADPFVTRSYADRGITNGANLTCASSCFFVLVGGIERVSLAITGHMAVGIHRPYLPPSEYERMNPDDAIGETKAIRKVVSDYLTEMDVPPRYADMLMSVPKDDVRWLSKDDMHDIIDMAPEVEDYMNAKCGTSPMTDIVRAALQVPHANRTVQQTEIVDRAWNMSKEISDCREVTKTRMRYQALKAFEAEK